MRSHVARTLLVLFAFASLINAIHHHGQLRPSARFKHIFRRGWKLKRGAGVKRPFALRHVPVAANL